MDMEDGFLKSTAQYNSFKCANTGIHLAVLQLENYSEFQYELPSPLFISGKIISPNFKSINLVKYMGISIVLYSHRVYIIFTDPDPPQIISIIGISPTMFQVTWSATQCNMGYPKEVSFTTFKQSGELLKHQNFNVTTYNESTGVGITWIERGQEFNVSYSEWIIRMLYNGRSEPVWSRPSQSYFAIIFGM